MIDFDFPIMKCVCQELEGLLLGGIIRNVYQPDNETLLLPIRCAQRTYHLLLSAHFRYPRLHLTERAWPHPPTPSSFCMLFRKHLRGTRISQILYPSALPVIHFHLTPLREGEREEVMLIGEFVEKYSNIFLVGKRSGLIIESVKHPPSPFRQIAPQLPYQDPTIQGYLHPQHASYREFIALCQERRALPMWKLLHRHVLGLNQWTARALLVQSGLSTTVTVDTLSSEQLQQVFVTLQSMYQSEQYTPSLVLQHQAEQWIPIGMSAFSPAGLDRVQKTQTLSSISEVLDRYYASRLQDQSFRQKQHALKQGLGKQIRKLKKRSQTFQQNLQEAGKAEYYLHLGELLKGHLGEIQKGQDRVEVINYYDPELRPILIPLEPTLSPRENVERYVKKYQKGVKGRATTHRLIQQTEEQLYYLQEVLYYIEQSEEEAELEALEYELRQQGFLPKLSSSSTSKPRQISTPRCFRTADQWEFLVGKNGRQNDLLVTQIGKGDDIWFHVRDRPGAHVLLRNPQRLSSLPAHLLQLGAQLAAYFSSARREGKVEVGYTPLKFVRKPKGAPPGTVYCQQWQTLRVPPHLSKELHLIASPT